MRHTPPSIDLTDLRREILGEGFRFRTPFGERRMLYADYTASGRNVGFVERYLLRIEESYANTHTEDDVTGRSTTRMLHRAEEILKRAVNGNETTCIIAAGTGATGGIKRLQEILGIYLPPATRARLAEAAGRGACDNLLPPERRPLVLVGPYEHHSNEVSWRESLADVEEVGLAADGGFDLADLARRLERHAGSGRLLIGSFSAASNVTGMITPVHDAARLMHRHGGIVAVDYAASAPYVPIDMNRDEESFLDAIYLSPHKFLGGPGSAGLLLFHRRIYRGDLPPTFAAGGTVDYVGFTGQDYAKDIDAREKPGTPGTLQILRAALAFELKEAVGEETIRRREVEHLAALLARLAAVDAVEILGNPDPERRIGIVSFNVRAGDRHLHPKFVTRLLNDLFGIQSRAGCSCAGPYGHRLLGIGDDLSQRYRCEVQAGRQGLKPGWVRISLHYVMDEIDVDFLARAVSFVAREGGRFLPLYRFDVQTGAWCHREEDDCAGSDFGLASALRSGAETAPSVSLDRAADYQRALAEAERWAAGLPVAATEVSADLAGADPELVYFTVPKPR